MNEDTREARDLQKALLSHASKVRWILRRLENLGTEPRIISVRVLPIETVLIMDHGVAHNPRTWQDLLGVWNKAHGEYTKAIEGVDATRREILGAKTAEQAPV